MGAAVRSTGGSLCAGGGTSGWQAGDRTTPDRPRPSPPSAASTAHSSPACCPAVCSPFLWIITGRAEADPIGTAVRSQFPHRSQIKNKEGGDTQPKNSDLSLCMYVHFDCYTLLERSLGRKGLLRDAQIYEVLLKFSMISLAAEIRQAAGKEMLPMACRRCVCSSTSAKGVTHWLKFTAASCTGPCSGFLMTLPDFKCWDLSFQAECLPWADL